MHFIPIVIVVVVGVTGGGGYPCVFRTWQANFGLLSSKKRWQNSSMDIVPSLAGSASMDFAG